MKILHIITRLILGGAQENTLLSCEGQAAAGHEVTLAYGPIYGPEGSLLQRAERGGYELAELPAMVRAIRPVTDGRAYRQVRQLIRRVQPDVVHTHSSKAGIIGRAAAWAEDVPAVVHTVHGLPFHPRQATPLRLAYVAAERFAARRCHAIVSVADAMTRQARAVGIGRDEQFTTIYSGMEIAPFIDGPDDRAITRRQLGIAEHDLVVGTVARLADLKGHDDLLDALPPLLRSRPKVKLLWVGDGWRRPQLERRIHQLGLADRVVIVGLVPPASIPAMLRAMDVLVHPSYREGLARALPQALLSRLPIVSYDCDGAGEVCIEGETGHLVPTGDRAALAEAVASLIDAPDRRTAFAARGHALCRDRFDAAVMVRRLDELYHHLLESAPSPQRVAAD